jgi:hypothetical protein
MAFNPNLPVENTPLDAAQMRDQFNGLKAIIDGLQAQLAPLVPVISRTAGGVWTLAYTGPALDYWQVWARYAGSTAWSETGELQTSNFPAADGDVVPDGATWWQIKLCGEDGDGKQVTPFSNVISFGPVP